MPSFEVLGICHRCAHRTRPFPAQCRAFPQGIPQIILDGTFAHTAPYPGDRGIQFKERGAPTVETQVNINR